ncbi:prokineticin-2 isoform X1 [Brienomyrus brachyistius]|uniref:prokineticin-2 isoform X1 n=1 Tax=Brienomyrus brachyistius TaxID=42636 RepID=UPI0020B3CCF2|nr:prokineticin-2 isoform X1 [Brienomyrus brachyistius]XP_048878572.1 prokineticin-2 isoform X1 [Brienomyrus brachyistius]
MIISRCRLSKRNEVALDGMRVLQATLCQACERDSQCGGAMCCAVSLWIRNLRMCTPMGQEGEDCHPLSHKVPFFGKRLHHTCPCLPNLACVRTDDAKSKCLPLYKVQDYYF